MNAVLVDNIIVYKYGIFIIYLLERTIVLHMPRKQIEYHKIFVVFDKYNNPSLVFFIFLNWA